MISKWKSVSDPSFCPRNTKAEVRFKGKLQPEPVEITCWIHLKALWV